MIGNYATLDSKLIVGLSRWLRIEDRRDYAKDMVQVLASHMQAVRMVLENHWYGGG